jgi:hypothetical protein
MQHDDNFFEHVAELRTIALIEEESYNIHKPHKHNNGKNHWFEGKKNESTQIKLRTQAKSSKEREPLSSCHAPNLEQGLEKHTVISMVDYVKV